MSKEDLTK